MAALERINQDRLLGIFDSLADGHVHYAMGDKSNPMLGKAPQAKLSTAAAQIHRLDCSGFVQYVLFNATDGRMKLPAGSSNQNDWFAANCKKVPYSDAGKQDDFLRVGHLSKNATNKMKADHIWLILDGQTLESHGGTGPDRRPWNARILLDNVDACYLVAATFRTPPMCQVKDWF